MIKTIYNQIQPNKIKIALNQSEQLIEYIGFNTQKSLVQDLLLATVRVIDIVLIGLTEYSVEMEASNITENIFTYFHVVTVLEEL